jgi:hypothetical protein
VTLSGEAVTVKSAAASAIAAMPKAKVMTPDVIIFLFMFLFFYCRPFWWVAPTVLCPLLLTI